MRTSTLESCCFCLCTGMLHWRLKMAPECIKSFVKMTLFLSEKPNIAIFTHHQRNDIVSFSKFQMTCSLESKNQCFLTKICLTWPMATHSEVQRFAAVMFQVLHKFSQWSLPFAIVLLTGLHLFLTRAHQINWNIVKLKCSDNEKESTASWFVLMTMVEPVALTIDLCHSCHAWVTSFCKIVLIAKVKWFWGTLWHGTNTASIGDRKLKPTSQNGTRGWTIFPPKISWSPHWKDNKSIHSKSYHKPNRSLLFVTRV